MYKYKKLKNYLRPFAVSCAVFAALFALSSCATVAETYQAATEPLSVELQLDRINTSARALELEEVILKAMPISAASRWPRIVASQVPRAEYGRLMGIVMREGLYSMRVPSSRPERAPVQRRGLGPGRRPDFRLPGRAAGRAAGGYTFSPSPIKIRVLYQQSLLFQNFPDMYYRRVFMDSEPTDDDIRRFGTRILGNDYSPVFSKSFYRFLKYSPAFMPKRVHFLEKFNGRSAEFYPNIMEAVISLAENRDAIRSAAEEMETVYDRRKEKLRDIDEKLNEINDLKEKNSGGAGIGEKKDELQVLEAELKEIEGKYREKMRIWKAELAGIKNQAAAFNDEQKALAMNIQHAIDAAKELSTESTALLVIALIKLPFAIINLPNELKELRRSSMAGVRIARIIRNSASLRENASIIKNELKLFGDEADTMDGLFENRIKMKTAGN